MELQGQVHAKELQINDTKLEFEKVTKQREGVDWTPLIHSQTSPGFYVSAAEVS